MKKLLNILIKAKVKPTASEIAHYEAVKRIREQNYRDECNRLYNQFKTK